MTDFPPQEWLENQIAAWLEHDEQKRHMPYPGPMTRLYRAGLLATHLRVNWQAKLQAEKDLAARAIIERFNNPPAPATDLNRDDHVSFLSAPEGL